MHPAVLAPRGRATGALKALDPEEVMGSSPIRGWDAYMTNGKLEAGHCLIRKAQHAAHGAMKKNPRPRRKHTKIKNEFKDCL